mmetsp:Transcript_10271/g.11374  ORF Transcript_10271/g.11374 Transcript_10271/m.11374 type:complete len:434 (-) Transcript_10271:176-1477(-)
MKKQRSEVENNEQAPLLPKIWSRNNGVGVNNVTSSNPKDKPKTMMSATDILIKKKIIAKRAAFHARRKFAAAEDQSYGTWKGRISVHVPVDEFDLKSLSEVVLSTLQKDGPWEMIDYYDVIRLWLSQESAAVPPLRSIIPEETEVAQVDHTYYESFHSGIYSGVENEENGNKVDFDLTPDQELKNDDSGDASTPEVYIFSFGAIIFWNFESEHAEKIWMSKYLFTKKIKDQDIVGDHIHADAIESANDEITFVYSDKNHFRLYRDTIYLATRDHGEKLAVTFALAKSAHVSIFEWRLDQTIDDHSHIPEELAKTGKISMSRKEISMEIGKIYLVKSAINLENNILDTPQEFWEDDKFHAEYKKAMEYFDIVSRLELVNARLQVMQDMNEILIEAVQSHHSSMLEWTVILLIVFEILVEIYRTYRDYALDEAGP